MTTRIKIEDYYGNDLAEIVVEDGEVIDTIDCDIADVDEDDDGEFIRIQLNH